MKNASFPTICLLLGGLLLLATGCEKELKISDLPPGVQTWITANRPGFSADEAETDVLCDGTEVFDVEAEKGEDEEIELTFDTNGTFLFSESEMDVADLPGAVTAGIATKFPGATIHEADKLAMADGSVRYELELKNATAKGALLDSEGLVICESGSKP